MKQYRIILTTCYQYLFSNDREAITISAPHIGAADIMALDIIKVMERHVESDSIQAVYDYKIKEV